MSALLCKLNDGKKRYATIYANFYQFFYQQGDGAKEPRSQGPIHRENIFESFRLLIRTASKP